MGFFDSLARMIINFVSGTWAFMKMIAGKVVNGTFGWYTGNPIPEDTAAYIIFGALVFALAVWIFFRRALVTK